jgi:hypothetical protein
VLPPSGPRPGLIRISYQEHVLSLAVLADDVEAPRSDDPVRHAP